MVPSLPATIAFWWFNGRQRHAGTASGGGRVSVTADVPLGMGTKKRKPGAIANVAWVTGTDSKNMNAEMVTSESE